jgi:hypothetical protein
MASPDSGSDAPPRHPLDPARLVVVGDSLAFEGPAGPVPLHEPRLYPNRLADRLEDATGRRWRATVVARQGWSVRDVWLALQKDVHLQQEVLLGADAVVMGVASFDWVAVGVPTPLRALVPYVRPTGLRRRLRRSIDRWHPALVRATGARLTRTPDEVYEHCWRKSIGGFRLFAPEAALCAVLPAMHHSAYYAHRHPHRERGAALTRRLADELQVPAVDLAAIGAPFVDELNRDGIHWGWRQHDAVAAALADALMPRPRAAARSGPG